MNKIIGNKRFSYYLAFFLLLSLMPSNALQAEPVQSQTVSYSVRFDATWSNETHPSDGFPTASAHFSPLIGAVHNSQIEFWTTGELSSAGIEQMAETGGTNMLRNEIDADNNANVHMLLSGSGTNSSPATVTINEFEVSSDFPLVTLVSMIAPSPDWFIGVSGLSLLGEDGNWVPELTVTLYPYDAGTEEGSGYSLGNPATDPQQPITRIRGEAPFSDEPIGTFTFTLDPDSLEPDSPPNTIYLPLIRNGQGGGTIPSASSGQR